MLCIFPDPYPDELLYSVCARYAALMNYPNRVTATRDFFGDGVSAVVDLPNRIGHLLGALPPGHLYSLNELIYQHTHYPFYVPFLPSGRALQVQNAMWESGKNRVAERIGISADRIKMPSRLRFCLACVEKDRATLGETYWHRIHQIPGVEVCPHHEVFLEESSALWRNPSNPGETFTAEDFVSNISARTLDTSEHTQFIQLNIARQALSLLERPKEYVTSQALQCRYHNLLLRQGLAYHNGQVRMAQLVRKLLDHYPVELLARLGCEIRDSHSNWLTRLLHTHRAGIAQHPIRHILFLTLIGCSTEEVIDSFVEFKSFGDGPWPCLNHASSHYAEPRVLSCGIRAGEKKNKGRPTGTFNCSCGFIYTRTGPDLSEADRFKWTSVQAYGAEWESLLKRLWEERSLTLRQIAQELGVNELTVKRRAISLGLIFPRPTIGAPRSGGEIPDRYRIKGKSHWEIQNKNRKTFLSLISDQPDTNRTELKALASHLIDWLRQWDPRWLDSHLPAVRKRLSTQMMIDWKEQDFTLAKAVKDAASQIHSIPIPKRVSITAVVKLVGHRSWIEKRLDKLPLTSKALDAHLECFEDYSIRRITWAADAYRKEGCTPSRAMLSKRAGIRGRLASKAEQVKSVLDLAIANRIV